ncbi:MAG: hypothetical protein ACHP79_06190 [Terriglobales bacterium]
MRFVSYKTLGVLALMFAFTAAYAQNAQSTPSAPSIQNAQNQKSNSLAIDTQKGFTEVETFQGTINADGRLFKIDNTLGWDFNKHFGVFAGLPLYFADAAAATTGTTSTTNRGMGNVYAGMAFRAKTPALNYAGVITVSAPTGSTANGFSTGRAGVDFTNHFAHTFHKFTPFLEGGVSNTVPDSTLLAQPFTSLGAITHWEEGADYRIIKHTYLGASGYQIVPFGSQTIFSKINGKGKGGNTFDNAPQTTGNGITRENGFNTWVAFEPTSLWRAEVGFTRSITFNLNSFAFNLRFNVGRILRSRRSS